MTDRERGRRVVRATEIVLAAIEFNVTRLWMLYVSGFLAAALVFAALWHAFFSAPPGFPAGHLITIESGAPLSETADALAEAGVIRSPLLFIALARLKGGEGRMQAGDYVFEKPVGVWRVEERVQDGSHGIVAEKITFPEGSTVRDMGRILKNAFPDFDEDGFLAEALPLEGFLFPDTYYFYPDVTSHEIVVRMYADFEANESTISDEVDAFDRPLRDDVIMASIIEDEARTLADKRMVAGILWNRVADGMPLQVDAVFGYINDRPTYSPSAADLATDSPYNTYLHAGLPPGPIGSPGLDSLLAAVTPAKTDDLYYLTGTDGQMHYAKTFAEHKANRAKYLD